MSVNVALAQTFDMLDAINDAPTNEHLWTTFFSLLSMFRVRTVIYHHLPSPGSSDFGKCLAVKHCLTHSDSEEADRIEAAFVESVRQSVRLMTKPMRWDNKTEAPALYAGGEGYALSSAVHGQLSGICVPVRGAKDRNGCFTIVHENYGSHYTETEVRVLRWACQNAHEVYSDNYMKTLDAPIKLTMREKEILTWVAKGKSNSVIAQIVGISTHTVNTYVRRIFMKTGTSDRTSAALCGISHGQICL